jgi:hypothetical protein
MTQTFVATDQKTDPEYFGKEPRIVSVENHAERAIYHPMIGMEGMLF